MERVRSNLLRELLENIKPQVEGLREAREAGEKIIGEHCLSCDL
jgi:hypothetical protein